MKIDIILGLQWGDEGKGKIVDVLTPNYDIIARFQGGPNAGHTLKFEGKKFVLHTIPSGIFRDEVLNLIGNGVVLDPIIFQREVESIREAGYRVEKSLAVGGKTTLILPTHRLLDKANEEWRDNKKIGSTLKGITPAYKDKTGRLALKVGDIYHDFKERYDEIRRGHISILNKLYNGYDEEELAELERTFFAGIDFLKQFEMVDEYFIPDALATNKRVLAEGAQGTMLDIDFGTYPYVTSSTTVASGVCSGIATPPQTIGDVMGVFKAYCTRVGEGPFPTEGSDTLQKQLRRIGGEFGATTGRNRRCGWLDLVALKYAVMINGVTKLVMMKADVLDGFETILICTAYRHIGEDRETAHFPYSYTEDYEPVYKEMKGWESPTTELTTETELPRPLLEYIDFIEEYIGVPVHIVSVGPNREQTILLSK